MWKLGRDARHVAAAVESTKCFGLASLFSVCCSSLSFLQLGRPAPVHSASVPQQRVCFKVRESKR